MKEAIEIQRRAETAEITSRRTAQAKLIAAQQQMDEMAANYEQLKEAMNSTEKEKATVIEGFNAQLEALRGEIARFQRDKDALHIKTRTQHDKIELLVNTLNTTKAELFNARESLEALTSTSQQAESRLEVMRHDKIEAEHKLAESQQQLQATKQELDTLQQTHAQRWRDMKTDIAAKYDQLTKQHTDEFAAFK